MPRVTCPRCGLTRELPAALVRADPRGLRCRSCGEVVVVEAEGASGPAAARDELARRFGSIGTGAAGSIEGGTWIAIPGERRRAARSGADPATFGPTADLGGRDPDAATFGPGADLPERGADPATFGPTADLPERSADAKAAARSRGEARSRGAGWQVAAVALGTALLVRSMQTRGFLAAVVSGADLVFHEAGHPIFGLLGSRFLMFLGGALGQLAFPVVSAFVFARRGRSASLAAALVWTGYNVIEIGRYAADGRLRLLPLLAPDEDSHDWWNLLGMLGLRARAEAIGGTIQALGWIVLLGAPAWLAWRWWRGRAAPLG